MTTIIGISGFYHDSAAVLLKDGEIVAAVQEERFSRIKHDLSFPKNSIRYCLSEAGCKLNDIDHFIFYEKPILKFKRLFNTYLNNAPKGFETFLQSMPKWISKKINLKHLILKEITNIDKNINIKDIPEIQFTEHHRSHAASAFFPSPFNKAAILCLDGVGEFATTSIWKGEDNNLTPLWEIHFPHSLGLLYSSFTYFNGFKVNSGEYKLMGLAPYGEPKYKQIILDNLIDVKSDGTFNLNMDYFEYETSFKMTGIRFSELFGGPRRLPESDLTQREMDIAASIQLVTEEIVLRLGKTIKKETGMNQLCMAGGVALNCVANGKLLRNRTYDQIWIQPASGDAGGALGAALTLWHEILGEKRIPKKKDSMNGSYLGPEYSFLEIENFLRTNKYQYKLYEEDELTELVAQIIDKQKIIGWFNGRMEFGPRALGNRSILGDPRSIDTQRLMNLKIKYRESFRPFAPVVKAEKAKEWFELDTDSPYMLLVAKIKKEKQIPMNKREKSMFGIEKLNIKRSELPAVTHVDYSARIQTVNKDFNPRLWKLLDDFEKLTGCPVMVNTSFNVRGEPIVCTIEDAYRCFMRTEMDYLVLGNFLLAKTNQPEIKNDTSWKNEFELD